MKQRRGFSLIELLVVVTIIGLLAAIVLPSVGAARHVARKVGCANNLHLISVAFQSGQASTAAGVRRPYPNMDDWPAIPQNVLSDVRMYLCPEQPVGVSSDGSDYALWATAADMLIPFEEGSNCRVVDRGEGLEYRFEAGGQGDGGDFNDVVFTIPKTGPRIVTLTPDGASFRGLGTMSLRYKGEVVPGWEDFRNVEAGKSFLMAGDGETSYGINAMAENIGVGDAGKIILLDYVSTVANGGEDVSVYLGESARHQGKLNVLFADSSVQTKGPMEVDPAIYPDMWSVSAP